MNTNPIKHYLPSIIATILAVIIWKYPQIAAFFVAGALILFALIYGTIVRHFHKLQSSIHRVQPDDTIIEAEYEDMDNPNFKNVTLYMFQKKWF